MAAVHPGQGNRFESYQSRQRSSRTDLEERITDMTLGDAVLFPDLRILQSYRGGPEWIRELDFPELLLNPEKTWKEYGCKKLSRKDNLFKTLRIFIKRIKNIPSQQQPPDIQSALERVQRSYKRYIQECCLTEGKQRRSLLKGPARLMGYLQGEFVCKELDRKRARHLVAINRYNDDASTNECGASAVAHQGGVFFKRARVLPLRPGNERLFDLFNNLFLGGRATPITLLNINNVYVKDLNGEKIRNHPAKKKFYNEWIQNGQQPPRYSQFVSEHPDRDAHPFEGTRMYFLIQASLGVEGDGLHRFLEEFHQSSIDNPNANLSGVVNPYNFQAMALLSLLLRVDDGRGDNYMIEQGGEVGREIVGIDNDGILSPPVTGNEDGHKIQLRSILFLLPDLMNQALNKELVAHLLSLDIEKTFISYLRDLDHYNRSQSVQDLSESELQTLSLPISLSLSNFLAIYHSLKTVQEAVRQNPESSIDDLFSLLFPIVHQAYKKLVEGEERNPIKFQSKIFNSGNPEDINSRTIVTIEKLLDASSEEVEESLGNLPGMSSNDSPLSIPELLSAFIDSFFSDLNAERQQEILRHTHSLFEDFNKRNFIGSKLSDKQFAEIVERKKVKEIFLENSEEITPNGLITLMNDFPELKIILGRNRNFDVNAFADLIKRAQKMQRPLYCQIHGKEYSLFGQNLKKVVEPAIEYGHFALAEALIKHFSFDLGDLDFKGDTFLHKMARRGTPDSVRFLIEKCHFPITAINSQGQTAFHIAADEGNVKTLETLIHFEAEGTQGLSVRDPDKHTPFHYATFKDRNEAVAFLLHEILIHRLPAEELIHLESDSDKYNLLHMAAKFGMTDEIPSLIDKYGFDVNVRGRFERTPLHMATHNGEVEAARKLIEKGADVNARCNEEDSITTPLHEAVSRGHTPIVELLLQSEEIDINLKNSKQFTPADIAVLSGNLPAARMLITHPDFQMEENQLEDYIEKAKRGHHWQLLPLLYTEQSLQLLGKMRLEDRHVETESIIRRFQVIAPPPDDAQ